MTTIRRLLAGLIALGGALALGCFVYAVADIRPFEWSPLWGFLGLRGVSFVAFIVAGLLLVTLTCFRYVALRSPVAPRHQIWLRIAVAAWALAIAWLAEWVYMEEPLTGQIADKFISPNDAIKVIRAARARADSDGSSAAFSTTLPHADLDKLAVMMARVRSNRPNVFDNVSIGRVICKYAAKYGVSPVLLLDWTYIDSWYGEAPAGRMPFFAEINGESFRDLVQAHLPWWFIESPIRVALIEGPWFSYFPGGELGVKLRYAFQKATYDIAISPYMNSVMSDTLLVLREYKSEFPEMFGPGAPSDPLADAFLKIESDSLLKPYDRPYVHAPMSKQYYQSRRADLISFARAAVYKLTTDFDFATKVQALVAKYYDDQYSARVGKDRWALVSERQKTALLAMLRDVYVPNIGHMSYNLYMVPEFNTTPIDYMAQEVARDFPSVLRTDRTWEPADRSRFWGATGLMLRTLAEVWGAATGTPLAGVNPANSAPNAIKVLVREQDL